MFGVTLLEPAGLTAAVLNPLLKLQPIVYSATDRGGFYRAEIQVRGPELAIHEALQWLRWGVEIRNEYGSVVWAGFVHDVECGLGGIKYTLSLEDLANRVTVLYSYEDVDGVQQAGQTDFAENDVSQDRYGVRELVWAEDGIEEAAAETLRDKLLEARQYPVAAGVAELGPVTALLRCRGWFDTLSWDYYTNNTGKEEHTDGGAVQPLGLAFTSDEVGFTKNGAIHEVGGKFLHFPSGQRVVVSGSVSNNYTFLLDSDAEPGPAETYAATTISFDATDDIRDSAAGLGFINNGSTIEVSGSADNDGYHHIDGDGVAYVTTHPSTYDEAIVTESAGNSVTIRRGNAVKVTTGVVNETPGEAAGNITVTCYGQKIAQSFELGSSSGWNAVRVAIELAATGAPADDVTVKLCSDSASAPGTALATGTIDGAEVGAALLWRWVDLSTTVTLATGTKYWLLIERTGAADWDDFFSVGCDEDIGYGRGAMRVWDGDSWENRPTNADLKFRVWGMAETTAQIEAMADGAEFVRGVLVDASGVSTNQYRDGTQRTQTEIEALLELGNSSGYRMVATIGDDRLLRVKADPGESAPAGVYRRDGTLATLAGNVMETGRLVAGVWLEIEDAPAAVSAVAPFSPRYCSGSEYDVANGTLRPDFEQGNPLDLGVRY